jgi:hypothetical protein
MQDEPFTLLLPSWLGERFDLARVIAESGRWTWTEGYRLLERFDVHGPERAFVKTLLARRTNLWLFRTNQRLACGDFIVVDMSAPAPADRRSHVIELKTGEPLALGGARLQCARHREALDEIAATTAVITAATATELVYGGAEAILAHLGVLSGP